MNYRNADHRAEPPTPNEMFMRTKNGTCMPLIVSFSLEAAFVDQLARIKCKPFREYTEFVSHACIFPLLAGGMKLLFHVYRASISSRTIWIIWLFICIINYSLVKMSGCCEC
jgi:hypothetical protein